MTEIMESPNIKPIMEDILTKLFSLGNIVPATTLELLSEVQDEVLVLAKAVGADPDPEFESERTPGDGSISHEDSMAARAIIKELERQLRHKLATGDSPLGVYTVPYHHLSLRLVIEGCAG